MIPDAIEVRLKPKERAVLESRLRAATTEQRQLLRIRIVLEAADGFGTREIARELDTTPTTVSLWRGRFARQRLDGLEDLPRSGTPPIYSEATRQAHSSGARSVTTQRLCPLERTADRQGPWRRRRAVRLAFPAQAQDRSRRSQELVREQRSGVCQQGCRCGRPLHGAARQCRRHMCGREAVDPGAGARAGLSEAAERTHADWTQPRLQAARHHDPVRRV